MNKGVLITLPQSDDVTEYLTVFSWPIIKECDERGIKCHKINNKEVIKSNVEQRIKSYNYKMNVFNGHGEIDRITGYKNQVIIDKTNWDILNNRINYARSCWSASVLGNSCMKENKEGCFIGYDIPFMFLIDTTWSNSPAKDNIAKVYFDTSNRVPIGLIKGQTAQEADENSKKAMLKEINKLLLSNDKDSENMAEILWNNYYGQTLIGNPEARL